MTGADGAVTLTRDDARDAWLWPSGRVAIGESAEAWRGLGAWPDVVGCFPIAYVKTAEEAASRLGARLPEGDSRPVLTLVGSTWCWPSEHAAILQDRDGVYRMWRDGSDTSISGTAPTLTAALQILGARLPTEPETLIARSDGGYGWPSGRWAIDPPDKHSGTYCAHRDSEADVNGAYFGRLEDAARHLCARLPDDATAIPLEDGDGVADAGLVLLTSDAREPGRFYWPSGRLAVERSRLDRARWLAWPDTKGGAGSDHYDSPEAAAAHLGARLPPAPAVCSEKEPTDPTVLEQEQARRLGEQAVELAEIAAILDKTCCAPGQTTPDQVRALADYALEMDEEVAQAGRALDEAGVPDVGSTADRIRALASRREPLDDRARGIAAELLAGMEEYAIAGDPPSIHIVKALRLVLGVEP